MTADVSVAVRIHGMTGASVAEMPRCVAVAAPRFSSRAWYQA